MPKRAKIYSVFWTGRGNVSGIGMEQASCVVFERCGSSEQGGHILFTAYAHIWAIPNKRDERMTKYHCQTHVRGARDSG